MYTVDKERIEKLFFEQIKRLSINAAESFDFQCSDQWLRLDP